MWEPIFRIFPILVSSPLVSPPYPVAGRLRNDRNTIFEIVKKTSLLLQFFIILHSYKYDGNCAGIHDACDIQIEHINHSII